LVKDKSEENERTKAESTRKSELTEKEIEFLKKTIEDERRKSMADVDLINNL
jgi:FixJ family two-component response regulator